MEFVKSLFRKYLRNEARPVEKEILDAWYEESGRAADPAWMSPRHLRQARAEAWQQLHARFGWPREPLTKGHRTGLLRLRPYMPYAAVLLLVLTGLATFRWGMRSTGGRQPAPERRIYATTTGIRKKLTLPDGSIVWLNNGSRLSLSPQAFNATGPREVWLEEGEAYFEVAKNPRKPFLVQVDSLQTRVLGTAFNIQAYRALSRVLVAVSHGSVEVSAGGRLLDTLGRNRTLTYYNEKGSFVVNSRPPDTQQQWWSHRFVLDKAGFNELALRLRLRYGVDVYSKNQRILQSSFSAGFPDSASLGQVLDVLCAIYKTSYRKEGQQIMIH